MLGREMLTPLIYTPPAPGYLSTAECQYLLPWHRPRIPVSRGEADEPCHLSKPRFLVCDVVVT